MAKPDTPSKVTLNLDTLEREGAPEPFAIAHGGRRYELQDPHDVDYRELLESQQLAAAGNPARAIELVVREEDREAFFANPMPSWKLEKLFRAYNEHFGLPSPGEALASPRS